MNETITINIEEYVKCLESIIKVNVLLDMINNGEPDYRVIDVFKAMYGLEKK